MTQPVAPIFRADQALAVYLEPLAERRRVLLLGDAEGDLALRLSDVAHTLEIIDPTARLPSDGEVPELPFDEAYFDLVVVVDVSQLPQPHLDAVRELRRVLADDGVLVLCARVGGRRRKRGALRGELERLLEREFRVVQVLGQAPLSGYSLGALDAPRDDEFTVDSSLVRGQRERAERLVAVGSDVTVPLEARLWVQVPVSEAAEPAAPQAPDPALVQALARAEEEAREALHRESELLREVEALHRAREQAERLAERAKLLDRKLAEAEGDYDDAVARIRYLEGEVLEREGELERERAAREESERALADARAIADEALEKLRAVEQEREGLRAEVSELSAACTDFERRLAEVGEQMRALSQDKKHHETVARDLLEELRRREKDELAAVEHDARVKELEAERERAVQRALEAELARESAQMRADELRAQLGAEPRRGMSGEERDAARGELTGLRLRVQEAEAALRAHVAGSARREAEALERAQARIAELEAALRAQAEAPSGVEAEQELDAARARIDALEAEVERLGRRVQDADRVVALEAELDRLDHRVRELTLELEEADRVAEAHAEDADRIDALEAELEVSRRRVDELDDELRATLEALRAAKRDAEQAATEASTRLELAQRREQEARGERDDARAALAEARAILAQLASKVDANAEDPRSIVQALEQRERPDELAELKATLHEREARLSQLTGELEAKEQRIRELERSLHTQLHGGSHALTPDAPERD